MIGDDTCNSDCNVEACQYDGNDCVQCSKFCPDSRRGDGVCNKECDIERCNFDDGDCESSDSSMTESITLIIVIVGVAIIALIICCVGAMVYRCFSRNRSRVYNAIHSSVDLAQYMDIDFFNERIPTAYFTDQLVEYGDSTCSVCLETMTLGVQIKKLTCKHLFHASCILEWLVAHKNDPKCPQCNANPIADYPV